MSQGHASLTEPDAVLEQSVLILPGDDAETKDFLEELNFRHPAYIGEGTYGKVYRVQDGNKREEVAVKITKDTSLIRDVEKGRAYEPLGLQIDVIREIGLLRELDHVNITSLREPMICKGIAICKFDYARYDLHDFVTARAVLGREGYTWDPQLRSIMYQILKGVSYLHANWIIHRDLKPSNVLVLGKDHPATPGRIKVTDFGLARVYRDPVVELGADGKVVTLSYRAPELLLRAPHYTPAVDIWSLGVIFAELFLATRLFHLTDVQDNDAGTVQMMDLVCNLLGSPLSSWPECKSLPALVTRGSGGGGSGGSGGGGGGGSGGSDPVRRLLDAISKPRRDTIDIKLKDAPQPARSLIRAMLAFDPAKRITAADALQHEYFSSSTPPSDNVFATLYGPAWDRSTGITATKMEQLHAKMIEAHDSVIATHKKKNKVLRDEIKKKLDARREKAAARGSGSLGHTVRGGGGGGKAGDNMMGDPPKKRAKY